jgi:iron-sulfur cluster repair protein YtfE (RIC family)
MFLHQLDKYSAEALTPEGLCDLIENKYQKEIGEAAAEIKKYMDAHATIPGLSDPISELVHLLFQKLRDEVEHLFKKESVIIFPCIKHHYDGAARIIPATCVENTVYRNIQGTHKVILNLMHKLRQVLNNYSVETGWSDEWSGCLDEMFRLENKIYNWIHLEQHFLYPKINN